MKSGNSDRFSFLGLQNHCGQYDCSHEIIRCLLLGRKVMTNVLLSLQLCLTLCDPIDGNPPDSAISGILQARTLEWIAIS